MTPLDDDARRRAAATKRQRTLEKIEDALEQLTAYQGVWIGDLTMRAIAQEAGISEATLYRYYSNLADLLRDTYLEADFAGDQIEPEQAILEMAHEWNRGMMDYQRKQLAHRYKSLTDGGAMDEDELAQAFVRALFAEPDPEFRPKRHGAVRSL